MTHHYPHPPQQHTYVERQPREQFSYPSADESDDPAYHELRQKAHLEAEARNECYEKSREAYNNGDGAKAKELSNEGHEHDRIMKEYNDQAANRIFQLKNTSRGPEEIDLHGLFVEEALERTEQAINNARRSNQSSLVVIVGQGHHSPEHIAKIKPAITDLVEKHHLMAELDTPNPGCITLHFNRGQGNTDFLDNTNKCIIM